MRLPPALVAPAFVAAARALARTRVRFFARACRRSWARTAVPILGLVIALSMPAGPARADDRADAIQAVIADQLAAFQRNDLTAAFAHAGPGIQSKFGDPVTFGRMVETGYPMVWRPATVQMRDLIETPVGMVQIVMMQGPDGRFHELGYLMGQTDGVWRIDGVKMRTLPGVGS